MDGTKAWFEASLLRQALPGPSKRLGKRYIRWGQRAFGLVLTLQFDIRSLALSIMFLDRTQVLKWVSEPTLLVVCITMQCGCAVPHCNEQASPTAPLVWSSHAIPKASKGIRSQS